MPILFQELCASEALSLVPGSATQSREPGSATPSGCPHGTPGPVGITFTVQPLRGWVL